MSTEKPTTDTNHERRALFPKIYKNSRLTCFRVRHRPLTQSRSPQSNAILIKKENADLAMDAAACIGCGACVAACPNASAMLFTSAKVSHLGLLPQGQPERMERVLNLVNIMDQEGFGGCTNHRECEAACPKEISVDFIARLNRDLMKSVVVTKE